MENKDEDLKGKFIRHRYSYNKHLLDRKMELLNNRSVFVKAAISDNNINLFGGNIF